MKTFMEDYNIWKNSDNVVEVENGFKTQCSQYSKTFTELELQEYFLKEYGDSHYSEEEVIEAKVVLGVKSMCARAFMDYPDFDATEEMDLAGALSVLVSELLPNEDPSKLYDFLTNKLK